MMKRYLRHKIIYSIVLATFLFGNIVWANPYVGKSKSFDSLGTYSIFNPKNNEKTLELMMSCLLKIISIEDFQYRLTPRIAGIDLELNFQNKTKENDNIIVPCSVEDDGVWIRYDAVIDKDCVVSLRKFGQKYPSDKKSKSLLKKLLKQPEKVKNSSLVKTRKVSDNATISWHRKLYYVGRDYIGKALILKPLKNKDFASGFFVYWQGNKIAYYDAKKDHFALILKKRKVVKRGTISVGKKTYYVGAEFAEKILVLKPFDGKDFVSGFRAFCEGNKVAYYDAKKDYFAQTYKTRKVTVNGTIKWHRKAYSVGIRFAHESFNLKPLDGKDFDSGFKAYHKRKQIAYYDAKKDLFLKASKVVKDQKHDKPSKDENEHISGFDQLYEEISTNRQAALKSGFPSEDLFDFTGVSLQHFQMQTYLFDTLDLLKEIKDLLAEIAELDNIIMVHRNMKDAKTTIEELFEELISEQKELQANEIVALEKLLYEESKFASEIFEANAAKFEKMVEDANTIFLENEIDVSKRDQVLDQMKKFIEEITVVKRVFKNGLKILNEINKKIEDMNQSNDPEDLDIALKISYEQLTQDVYAKLMMQMTENFKYSESLANDFSDMIKTWIDDDSNPLFSRLAVDLENARYRYENNEISKDELANIEKDIILKLGNKIREQIKFNVNRFTIKDIIKYKCTRCIGYSQLLYVLGSVLGVKVNAVDVLLQSNSEPFNQGVTHYSNIVHLSNGQSFFADLAHESSGWYSFAFSLDQRYIEDGYTLKLNDDDNPLTLYRRFRMADSAELLSEIYANQASYSYKLKNYKKAISLYDKAIELDPKNIAAYLSRGGTHSKIGQQEQCISDCNKAIELSPICSDAYFNRGNGYLYLDQYEQAVSDYTKALELNPKAVGALRNRKIAYEEIAKLKRQNKADLLTRTQEIQIDILDKENISLRDLRQEDELVKNMIETIISILLSADANEPKLVLAFHNKIFDFDKNQKLKRLIEKLEELKNKKGFDKLLKNLTIIKDINTKVDLSSEKLKSKGIDIKDKDTQVFMFAPDTQRETFTDLHIGIKSVYINEGNSFNPNFDYYPLAEVVTISLVKYHTDYTAKHILNILKRLGDDLSEFNLADIIDDENNIFLIFKLIPKAKRQSEDMKRYNRINNLIDSAA